MKVIADLQIHSKYAQAVSKYMELPTIAAWANKKGMGLVGTGDWTHPEWLKHLKENLVESSPGIYELKDLETPSFLLATEVACIFYQDNKYHGVHMLIYAPSFATVDKINKEFEKRGWAKNLRDDGRPVLPINCRDLAALVLDIDEKCLVIPAHSWTPWFGYFGARGGFMSLEEGFRDYTKYIYAIETGLGSDPAMNWRIKELENRNIVSFSDAHSAPKMAREATIFDIPGELTYEVIREAIVNKQETRGQRLEVGNENNPASSLQPQISYTIEFYRQEGKYFGTGHRKCGVSFLPENTPEGYICPVCGKKLTVGAAQRTEDIASVKENVEYKIDENKVRWVYSKDQPERPPFVNIIPLQEVLSEIYKVGVQSKKVQGEYERLTSEFAPEFEILLNSKLSDIEKFGGEQLAEGIERNRKGEVEVIPGYDGVFGKVKIDLGDKKLHTSPQQELF